MATHKLTREKVLQVSRSLPSFPIAVADILACLDDPDSSFDLLVQTISHDPLISARVLSVANTVAVSRHRDGGISDIGLATAMIGMDRVRHITLISSLSGFVSGSGPNAMPPSFWQHSVAVGICAQELTQHIAAPVSATWALVTGLLHDIGQLLLYRFDPKTAQACWREATTQVQGVDEIERTHFGIDHSEIGGWLAESWSLPADVVAGISRHHHPDIAPAPLLVPLTHVAEVLSNALDLGRRPENRVTHLSSQACHTLGLVWDDDIQPLFGRIEARSRHANAFFGSPGQ